MRIRAEHIEAVARCQQEKVARLTDDIDSLQEMLESEREWREESNCQARDIKDIKKRDAGSPTKSGCFGDQVS